MSKIKVIHLKEKDCASMFEESQFPGRWFEESEIKELVTYDADVYKPNGDLLIKYRKNVIPKEITETGYEGLRGAAKKSMNRGIASGFLGKEAFGESMQKRIIPTKGGLRYRYFRKDDGGFSNTNIAAPVFSGIAGYFDADASRFPYCRTTAYTKAYFEKYEKALPFIQYVSKYFKELVPDRWINQKAYVENTNPDWIIPETVFTTVTINKNYKTGIHTDAGDLKEGFGNLTCFRKGYYEGCYTGFPKYKVAVDLHEGDFLAMDVHEWHGNTDFKNMSDDYERISVVCYYREMMHICGSIKEEDQKRLDWESRHEDSLEAKNKMQTQTLF